MKITLVAVTLVLAILFGLKTFILAVARPIERAPVVCAEDQDSTYLMPCAMKLLDGGSIEEVAAEMMNHGNAMTAVHPGKPARQIQTPQPEQGFFQKACAMVKAWRSEDALHLRGVTTGPKPLIIVNHVTLAPGEEASIPLVGHNVTVGCLEVTARSARISVNGKATILYLASEHEAQP